MAGSASNSRPCQRWAGSGGTERTPVVRARRDRATANAELNPVKMPQEAILNSLKRLKLQATPTLGRFRRNRAYGRFTPTLHQRA